MMCPDCGVERADYEGPNGAWLVHCPNCFSTADPIVEGRSFGVELTEAMIEAAAQNLGLDA